MIYRDGHAVSRCKITLGGFLGSAIAYSNNDTGPDNSCNEQLTVESDDQSLYMKPLMGGWTSPHGRDAHLSPEGASEHLWSILVQPIQ